MLNVKSVANTSPLRWRPPRPWPPASDVICQTRRRNARGARWHSVFTVSVTNGANSCERNIVATGWTPTNTGTGPKAKHEPDGGHGSVEHQAHDHGLTQA
jgi:hypothetical protein